VLFCSLAANNIGTEGAVALAAALEANNSVKVLRFVAHSVPNFLPLLLNGILLQAVE
jgi:hypothetical protein